MRLRQLRREFPHLQIEHKAFVLVSEEGSRPAFAPYHLSHRSAAAQRTGLPFSLPDVGDPYPLSSWPSQQAAAWVRRHRPEHFSTFDEALFRAFFVDNEDIADLEVLKQVSGLPDLGMTERTEIAKQHQEALGQGIRSIPTVIVDGKEAISGAVEYEVYKDAVLRSRGTF